MYVCLWGKVRSSKDCDILKEGENFVSVDQHFPWGKLLGGAGMKVRTPNFMALPHVPSPTRPHPVRGDSGYCLVWSVFPTAFIVPHHFQVRRQLHTDSPAHCTPSGLGVECTHEVGQYNHHRGSNAGRQISSPVLYQLSYPILKTTEIKFFTANVANWRLGPPLLTLFKSLCL